MVHRRRIIGCVFLAFSAIALCIAIFLLQLPPKPFTFSVGGQSYTFTVEGASAAAPQLSAPDIRPLRTRTAVTFPMMQEKDSVGTVTLTLDETAEGIVFYLQSNASVPLTAHITSVGSIASARAVPYGEATVPQPEAPLWEIPYDADSALYLESADTHFYLSRIASLRGLGQSVYVRTVPPEGASLLRDETEITVSVPLAAGTTACSGVVTEAPLIHWNDPNAPTNVWNLDSSDIDYHLLADGVYIAMPDSYRPRDGEQPHIYRAATAWLLGPCTYDTNGPLFTALGKAIVYTYLDHINDAGFLATEPSSTWLCTEYGIGAGFYDTRFNFDTMKRLMHAEAAWGDPAIGNAVRRMIDFYLEFSQSNQFKVDDVPFVPDYGAPISSRNALPAPAVAACSLNHYLAEGLVLLRAGAAYHSETYTARGYEIMNAIHESAARWIRPNRDLWYAMRPDGNTEKADYIQVTYLDLVDACALLSKLGVWQDYEGIQALLAIKEEWLIDTGRRNMLVRHAAFSLT